MKVVTGRVQERPRGHARRNSLRILILLPLVGLSLATGCGDGGTPSGVGDILSDECRISDPGFPFCGAHTVRCRNHDATLYQVFDEVCPPGWTVLPDNAAFPDLACTDPEGRTFNVDAEECPAGWKEFSVSFSLPPGLALQAAVQKRTGGARAPRSRVPASNAEERAPEVR